MAKVPYIPLYIGDWEQDTNCLSLQAEAAWLKIVIKMFKDNKSGIYKTSTKALQNLWRCSDFVVQEIIQELKDNNICDFGEVAENDNSIVFRNRRMLKESIISEKRTKAVQKRYKTPTNDTTKGVQNPEYETEYDTDTENVVVKEEGLGETNQVPILYQLLNLWTTCNKTYKVDQMLDLSAIRQIAVYITGKTGIEHLNEKEIESLKGEWKRWCTHILNSTTHQKKSLDALAKFSKQQIHNELNGNYNETYKPNTNAGAAPKPGTSEARITRAKTW